jgi:hypothetical protein
LGTIISNLAPFPWVPVSWIMMPVIARISRARKSPQAGVLPESLLEDLLLQVKGDPDPVVLHGDQQVRTEIITPEVLFNLVYEPGLSDGFS